MFCRVCGKENPDNMQYCRFCGRPMNDIGARGAGVGEAPAIIRIKCRKKKNLVRMMLLPIIAIFAPYYKIYVYIDGREYVMSSKEGQHDFMVVPGEHRIFLWHKRINRERQNKIIKLGNFIGDVVRGAGVINGNVDAYILGESMRALEAWDGSEELQVNMLPGSQLVLPCKCNYFNMIKYDKTL